MPEFHDEWINRNAPELLWIKYFYTGFQKVKEVFFYVFKLIMHKWNFGENTYCSRFWWHKKHTPTVCLFLVWLFVYVLLWKMFQKPPLPCKWSSVNVKYDEWDGENILPGARLSNNQHAFYYFISFILFKRAVLITHGLGNEVYTQCRWFQAGT